MRRGRVNNTPHSNTFRRPGIYLWSPHHAHMVKGTIPGKLSTNTHQVTVEQMKIIHHIHGFLGQVLDIWTYLNNPII